MYLGLAGYDSAIESILRTTLLYSTCAGKQWTAFLFVIGGERDPVEVCLKTESSAAPALVKEAVEAWGTPLHAIVLAAQLITPLSFVPELQPRTSVAYFHTHTHARTQIVLLRIRSMSWSSEKGTAMCLWYTGFLACALELQLVAAYGWSSIPPSQCTCQLLLSPWIVCNWGPHSQSDSSTWSRGST